MPPTPKHIRRWFHFELGTVVTVVGIVVVAALLAAVAFDDASRPEGMSDAPGIVAALAIFPLWLIVARSITSAMRRQTTGGRLKAWQLTVTQLLILLASIAVICWLCRMIYLDRFGPV
jgi:hypothetical protein